MTETCRKLLDNFGNVWNLLEMDGNSDDNDNDNDNNSDVGAVL